LPQKIALKNLFVRLVYSAHHIFDIFEKEFEESIDSPTLGVRRRKIPRVKL